MVSYWRRLDLERAYLDALVALHVAGVVLTGWQHRENLVRAMLTGRKPAPGEQDIL